MQAWRPRLYISTAHVKLIACWYGTRHPRSIFTPPVPLIPPVRWATGRSSGRSRVRIPPPCSNGLLSPGKLASVKGKGSNGTRATPDQVHKERAQKYTRMAPSLVGLAEVIRNHLGGLPRIRAPDLPFAYLSPNAPSPRAGPATSGCGRVAAAPPSNPSCSSHGR